MIKVTVPKSTCPYIAIPVEGERPFVIKRDLYIGATRGINITDCVLEYVTGDIKRQLVITHITGRVRGRAVFYDAGVRSWDYKIAILNWAEKQRKSHTAISVPSTIPPKFRVVIKRLQREFRGLYLADRPPQNPLCRPLEGADRHGNNIMEHWYQERTKRKQVAKIAGLVLSRRIAAPTGYKLLRAMGFTVKTLAQLGVTLRREVSCESDYWKQAWRFCGIAYSYSNPRGRFGIDGPMDYTDALKAHIERRVEYLSNKRQAVALREQVETVRQLTT